MAKLSVYVTRAIPEECLETLRESYPHWTFEPNFAPEESPC